MRTLRTPLTRFSFAWLRRCLKQWLNRHRQAPTDRERALRLIAAIDAGGVPLNPARVNDIARNLGLEVSRKARVEDTVARIRAAVDRQGC
jgi:hypothetical protein